MYGIGKKSVIKHLKQNFSLANVDNMQASLEDVHNKSARLVALCYGVKNRTNLLQVRFTVWGKKTRKKLTSAPKLQSLSPTTEVNKEVNIQASIWNSYLQSRHPKMDPCQVKFFKSLTLHYIHTTELC